MSSHRPPAEVVSFDAKTTEDLVDLLNQSLADTLDLAYQTRRARWNVRGPDSWGLNLLFDQLYGQLAIYGDGFAERVATAGGHRLDTSHAVGSAAGLIEYPLDVVDGKLHMGTLVDHYGEYAGRMRKGVKKAGRLGDQPTADFYATISHAMDKALWMLTAHEDA